MLLPGRDSCSSDTKLVLCSLEEYTHISSGVDHMTWVPLTSQSYMVSDTMNCFFSVLVDCPASFNSDAAHTHTQALPVEQ